METVPHSDTSTVHRALRELRDVYARYGVAGAFCVADLDEVAYGFPFAGEWNACLPDEATPMGFRIATDARVVGQAQATVRLYGTVWLFRVLDHFGRHCSVWGQGFLDLLQNAGLPVEAVEHEPDIPRIFALDVHNEH